MATSWTKDEIDLSCNVKNGVLRASGLRHRRNIPLDKSLYEPSWPNVTPIPTKKFDTILILTSSVYK